MDLLQLQYFRAIATYGSMSKAAQMLFVSQPTLSITMTRLEEKLGFSLFVRKKGKLSLTPEGQEFLQCVDRVLGDLDNTIKNLRASSAGQEETIRVASCLNDLLGVVVGLHYDDLRDLRIHQQYCDNENVAATVAERKADWGIVYGPAHAMQLSHTLLHQSPRVFVMREGHPLLRHERLPAEALAAHSYVCNRSRDEQDVLTMLGKRYHFTPQVDSECDDVVLEMHILNSTDCISTMPALTLLKLQRMSPDRPLRYLLPGFHLPDEQTFIIHRHESAPSAYSMRLIKHIRSFLEEEDKKLALFLEKGIVS